MYLKGFPNSRPGSPPPATSRVVLFILDPVRERLDAVIGQGVCLGNDAVEEGDGDEHGHDQLVEYDPPVPAKHPPAVQVGEI